MALQSIFYFAGSIHSIFRIIIYFGIFTNALLITNTSKWSIGYLRDNFTNRVIFFLVYVVFIYFSNENYLLCTSHRNYAPFVPLKYDLV